MDFIAVAGLCIAAAVICSLFKNINSEYAIFISLAVGIAIILLSAVLFAPIIEKIQELCDIGTVNQEYVVIAMKALGICYISQFSSDICRDAGQNAIADKIELAGKIWIIYLSLPLFSNMLQVVKNLLEI